MMTFKNKPLPFYKSQTLERFITIRLLLLATLLVVMGYFLLAPLQWPLMVELLILTGSLALFISLAISFKRRIVTGFERALLHLEGLRMEDYNQHAKAEFNGGCVGDFHNELKALSEELINQKSRYDQHAFLVYQLIDQLNTPIMVFNQYNKLSYANGAFTLLYPQHWQMYRQASPKLLSLVSHNDHWKFSDENKNQQWQISQSEFIDDGEAHQLLVFTNIESALRASQLNAWQQIIRVMSHEIRNSLTPVSSLAESLMARTNEQRDQQALALISDRCLHLQDFISRYSSLSQSLNLNLQLVPIKPLVERLKGLFSQTKLEVNVRCENLWADAVFLEQVLINLIKNSDEAGADLVQLNISEHQNKTVIEVIDNGHGFANLDNLFVPLYTTKQDGQGIGLSFCRNIIEQHQGSIELTNKTVQKVNNTTSNSGVSVLIRIPLSEV